MTPPALPARLVRAGLVTGVTDALFSSTLVVVAYGSTVTRLWQNVASTLLGPASFEGGWRTAAVGLLLHFGVAFAWSAVFLLASARLSALRQLIATPGGALAVAAVYGPCIWLVMSCVVIPLLVHRPPTVNVRWWVQFVGHVPFVAVPIVFSTRARG